MTQTFEELKKLLETKGTLTVEEIRQAIEQYGEMTEEEAAEIAAEQHERLRSGEAKVTLEQYLEATKILETADPNSPEYKQAEMIAQAFETSA